MSEDIKVLRKQTVEISNSRALVELLDGNEDHAVFFTTWVKCGFNATQAYLTLHPDVNYDSARVLGSKILSKINIQHVLATYGLGLELYIQQLHDGLKAMKVVPVRVANKDQTITIDDLICIPDHKTRLGYHDKLGQLLGIEKGNAEIHAPKKILPFKDPNYMAQYIETIEDEVCEDKYGSK